MAELFANMVETHLHFYSPMLIDIYLLREEHPKELRICLKVKYDRCELRFSSYAPDYTRRLHILHSTGVIEIKKLGSDKWIRIYTDKVLPSSLDTTKKTISVCSKPLSLEEIHYIADAIRGEKFDVRWSLSGYGFIPYEDLYYTLRDLAKNLNRQISELSPIPSPLVIIKAEGTPARLDYLRFAKNIVAPAELIDRIFIELALSPMDREVLDRISDPEVRDALEILFEKQRILREALEEYRKAVTASDNKNAVYKVRGAIEHLTANKPLGSKVFNALAKALDGLGVIREITPGSGARSREISKIKEDLNKLSNALYGLASTLGVHQTDYEPKPYTHDVELILHTAFVFINYMIKVLLRYATRT